MSILSPIIKSLIIKELKSLMKDFIQPILDLVKTLVQPEKGTKFLITLAGLGAIYYMHSSTIATDASDVVIAIVVVAYFVADIFHKLRKETPNA